MLPENDHMVGLLSRASAALKLLDGYGVAALNIRLEGSAPVISVDDPTDKLPEAHPVFRLSEGGVKEAVYTLRFLGARLEWRAQRH